jgi:DNA-binding transcriptional regulator PaaX
MNKQKLGAALLKFFMTQDCQELNDRVAHCISDLDTQDTEYKELMQQLQHEFESVAQDIITSQS